MTAKETVAVAAEEKTLNFVITEVTFGEIVLSNLGALMRILSLMAILNGLE